MDKKEYAQQVFEKSMGLNIRMDRLIPPAQLDLLSAIVLISQIQLAGRHPENKKTKTYALAAQLARRLQAAVVDVEPQLEEILQMGWNAEFDY
jgi:hypothetical protein